MVNMHAINVGIPSSQFFQFNKSAIIQKKLKKAQSCINSGQFAVAQTLLNGVLKLSPNNSQAKSLQEKCRTGLKRQKEQESYAYRKACSSKSINSLRTFISQYPQSTYVEDAKNRIADFELWNQANTQNTIEGYRLYLKKSSQLAYKQEAIDAIDLLHSNVVWPQYEKSNDVDTLKSFIAKYPQSAHVKDAEYLINIFRGEDAYQKEYFDLAKMNFAEANAYKPLLGDYAEHFKVAKFKSELYVALASNDEWTVRTFLSSLPPKDPCYDKLSNRLAILRKSRRNVAYYSNGHWWKNNFKPEFGISFSITIFIPSLINGHDRFVIQLND